MTAAFTFVIYALATARLSVLVTEDKITERIRNALVRRWAGTGDAPRESYRAYLLVCQWCVSVWIGAVAALVWHLAGTEPWALVPAAGLAMSYVTGKLAQVGG